MPLVENKREIEMVEMSIPKMKYDISEHHVPTGNYKDPLETQTYHFELVRQ